MTENIKSFLLNPIVLGIIVCLVIFSICLFMILSTLPNFDEEGCALDKNGNRIRKDRSQRQKQNKNIIHYNECVKSNKNAKIIAAAVFSVAISGAITMLITNDMINIPE